MSVVLAVLAVAGCGSDAESSRSDADQCRDMVDTYCAKEASCAPSSERTNRGEDCEFNLKLYTPCQSVVVKGDMAWCLNSIDTTDCGSFDAAKEALPWPDACKGILGLP